MESSKYPRTPHLPWSLGSTNDDKLMTNVSTLLGTDLIISEKVDGSCVCMMHESCYARTHSGPPTHPSFDAFKSLHANVKFAIPDGIQIFGEWMFALHSISYKELPGYFIMFGVRYVAKSMWASWDEVQMWAEELGVPTVPVLCRVSLDSERELRELTEGLAAEPSACGGEREGVVARVKRGFLNEEFPKLVAKLVRKDHVNSNDDHWKRKIVVKNLLKTQ